MIRAEIHTSDMAKAVAFDATPYFQAIGIVGWPALRDCGFLRLDVMYLASGQFRSQGLGPKHPLVQAVSQVVDHHRTRLQRERDDDLFDNGIVFRVHGPDLLRWFEETFPDFLSDLERDHLERDRIGPEIAAHRENDAPPPWEGDDRWRMVETDTRDTPAP